ncbi:MAG: hypothetical protein JWM33_201 [Caulobacteraceae bacterium]|nr:hypothetical protein [Caulobacteraceae bacterium]
MAALSGGEGATAAAHARLLADKSLQFDFPPAPAPAQPPEWLKALIRLLDQAAPGFKWVMWGLLALIAALILFLVIREVIALRWSRKAKAKPAPTPDWAPDHAKAKALLQDADALAASGDYAGAARALLHRSIDDLDQRRGGVVRPSLTSRDIARLDALPQTAKPAFGLIAEVVERSLFGGAGVEAADFARCRAAYEAFAFGRAWT